MNVFNNITLFDKNGKCVTKHKVPTSSKVEMGKDYTQAGLFALVRKRWGKED